MGHGCRQYRARQSDSTDGTKELKLVYANGVEVIHGNARLGGALSSMVPKEQSGSTVAHGNRIPKI